MNNSEHIRDMTDEELAFWIQDTFTECPTVRFDWCKQYAKCTDCWYAWLIAERKTNEQTAAD